MLIYSALQRLVTLMLITSLLSFASSVCAQSATRPALPPDTINFAGVTYHLAIEESDNNFGKYHYRPERQSVQPHYYPELILDWASDEFIFDSYDERSCSRLKDEPIFKSDRRDTHFVTYQACNEILSLKNKEPGVIHVHTNQREIVLTSIIADSKAELGEFVELTISRYIPIPINHYDYINSVLHYAYKITVYGPYEEQAVILLEKLNQDGEQWLKALLSAPVPQFILDKASLYKDCDDLHGANAKNECP